MDVKKGEIFNSVQVPQLPRNTFDLSHQHVTTMNFAELVPICVMEAVPGDIFNITSDTFIRLQPLITPMMHRCDFTVHYFFVPNRILWDGWEDFITGNLALTSGLSTPAAPYFTSTEIAEGTWDSPRSLLNYMGMEIQGCSNLEGVSNVVNINALPAAAYQKIYWDYYVPRELVSPGTDYLKLVDGNNDAQITDKLTIRRKGWVRDYFTSALPYAQKGDQVAIPMDGVITAIQPGDPSLPQTPGGWRRSTDGATYPTAGNLTYAPGQTQVGADATGVYYDPNGSLVLENTTTTINDLRRAIRLQEWLEKNARAGTRYSESLKAHFDVTSSDARLQRAEYITGIKSPIIVSEVLNTSGFEGQLPQGNMSGHAIGIADSYGDSFFCEEHGFVLGLLSVTPKPAYTSGIPRFFVKRFDNLDYYWNEFANIGEQEIMQVEIQTDWTGEPTDVFGYTPRYSEYKFKNDMITGDFADGSTPGNLRTWVMQRRFQQGANAALTENFISGDIATVASAPFAIEDTPIMVQQINKLKVSRLMPVYGTPTF